MLWMVLFLDLVAPMPKGRGDDTVYRQAMADHHLTGFYDLALTGEECAQVARNGGDLAALHEAFVAANPRPERPAAATFANTHFSKVGWDGARAYVQLTTGDATSCLVYRRVGASVRLVREIRLPH